LKPPIILENVSKKFSRSYISDSLRDAIAAPFKRLFGRDGLESIKEKSEFWAVKGVSFDVKPGEVLGIIGSNGSGKSTILKLLSKILHPDGGRIEVRGRVGALIELGAGFSPDLTGRENVFLNASILGMNKDEIKRKFNEIVEFADLHEFMDTPVKWYSSGMVARLGFSVASHIDPEILLVDEVLSVGDIGFQRKCIDKMHSFKENKDISIVFVSHNMSSVASLCDRVIMLGGGRVLAEGHPEEVISKYVDNIMKPLPSEEYGAIKLIRGIISRDGNSPCNVAVCGDKIQINTEFEFMQDFQNLDVGLSIVADNGVRVFRTTAQRLTGKGINARRGQTLKLTFELTANLAPRKYEVLANVTNQITSRNLFKTSVGSFYIQQNPRFGGFAFLDPHIVDMDWRNS